MAITLCTITIVIRCGRYGHISHQTHLITQSQHISHASVRERGGGLGYVKSDRGLTVWMAAVRSWLEPELLAGDSTCKWCLCLEQVAVHVVVQAGECREGGMKG